MNYIFILLMIFEAVVFIEKDFWKIRNAERQVKKLIDELTNDRLLMRRNDIRDMIDKLYVGGTFSKKRRDKLLCNLDNKYTQVYDAWMQKTEEDYERNFQAFMHSSEKS